ALLILLARLLDDWGEDGIAFLGRAQAQRPGEFWLNFELGNVLTARKRARWVEAEGYLRAALALRPRAFAVYNNLVSVLQGQKNLAGAIAAYQQAIALAPKDATAYSNLGTALHHKLDLPGAIAAFKKAIALDPKYATAHSNLGAALYA